MSIDLRILRSWAWRLAVHLISATQSSTAAAIWVSLWAVPSVCDQRIVCEHRYADILGRSILSTSARRSFLAAPCRFTRMLFRFPAYFAARIVAGNDDPYLRSPFPDRIVALPTVDLARLLEHLGAARPAARPHRAGIRSCG